MNTQENKLIDLKFKNMNDNMEGLDKKLDKGFSDLHKRMDKQEDSFVTKDQHKLVIKDVNFIKGLFGSAGGIFLVWIVGKFLALI